MKVKIECCSFLLFLFFYFINFVSSYKIVKVKHIFTNEDNSYRKYNPLEGMDYWETKRLSQNEYVDWMAELEDEVILNSLYLEFDYPPSKIIVYFGRNETHLLPHEVVDNRELLNNKFDRKAILFSKSIEIKRNLPSKFVKLRFTNEMNIPIKVQFLKFTAFSEESEGRYIISKMVYSDGKLNSYCLKWDKTKNRLTLAECYYCLMYSVKNCNFVYKGEDSVGIIFSYEEGSKSQEPESIFYLKNFKKSEETYNRDKLESNPAIRQLTSFLSDEVDLSTEIITIKANSTISNDYPIQNVLYDNLDYWSSTYIPNSSHCQPVMVEIPFVSERVIKTIMIQWINPPKILKLFLCLDKEGLYCQLSREVSDFKDLTSKIENIYQKAFIIKIIMVRENTKCYTSIKRIILYKNEIELKSLDGNWADIDYNNSTLTNKKNLFTDNFLLTKINNDSLLSTTNEVDQLFQNYTTQTKEITNFYSMLESSYSNTNSIFSLKIGNILGLSNKYEREVTAILKKIQYFNNNLKDSQVKKEKGKYLMSELSNTTYKSDSGLNSESLENQSYLHMLKLKLDSIKNFYKNFINIRATRTSSREKSMAKLNQMKNELNTFLEDNATKFSDAFSDQYVTKAFETANGVFTFYDKSNKLDNLNATYSKFLDLEEGILSLRRMHIPELNKNLLQIKNSYQTIFTKKEKELSEYLVNFQILLQSIKLINMDLTKVFLPFPIGCFGVDLITNSYMDDFLSKVLVSYSPSNRQKTDMFIFKLISKEVFFYITYTDKYIEIWKKKYEIEKILFRYENCTTDLDKYNQLENFSKLYYLHIEVHKGELTVKLAIDYHPVPRKILTHLDWLMKTNYDYDKLIRLNALNTTIFEEYYENANKIYVQKDVDLLLSGYFGLYTPRNNTSILMVDSIENEEQPAEKDKLMYLDSKYNYNYFQDIRNLKISSVDFMAREFLGLDNSWNFYNTHFQILSNFYFKFEVDLKLIFGDSLQNSNFSSCSTSKNLEELQNSVYFFMNSTMTEHSYFFEIVKVDQGFIFKLFYMNKLTKRKINIFRKRVDTGLGMGLSNKLDSSTPDKYTFIFVKNKESVTIHIKSKSRTIFKSVFTMGNFNFVEFSFLLNAKNSAAVSSIYFSDTYSGSFSHRENEAEGNVNAISPVSFDAEKIKNKCSLKNYNSYKCVVGIRSDVCIALFCKSCCTKKLMKEAKKIYNKCFDVCKEGLKEKKKYIKK